MQSNTGDLVGGVSTTPTPSAGATPVTDAAELDGSVFSDWGYGPSGYVKADDMREMERSRDSIWLWHEQLQNENSQLASEGARLTAMLAQSRGEYICNRCMLRQDAPQQPGEPAF